MSAHTCTSRTHVHIAYARAHRAAAAVLVSLPTTTLSTDPFPVLAPPLICPGTSSLSAASRRVRCRVGCSSARSPPPPPPPRACGGGPCGGGPAERVAERTSAAGIRAGAARRRAPGRRPQARLSLRWSRRRLRWALSSRAIARWSGRSSATTRSADWAAACCSGAARCQSLNATCCCAYRQRARRRASEPVGARAATLYDILCGAPRTAVEVTSGSRVRVCCGLVWPAWTNGGVGRGVAARAAGVAVGLYDPPNSRTEQNKSQNDPPTRPRSGRGGGPHGTGPDASKTR